MYGIVISIVPYTSAEPAAVSGSASGAASLYHCQHMMSRNFIFTVSQCQGVDTQPRAFGAPRCRRPPVAVAGMPATARASASTPVAGAPAGGADRAAAAQQRWCRGPLEGVYKVVYVCLRRRCWRARLHHGQRPRAAAVEQHMRLTIETKVSKNRTQGQQSSNVSIVLICNAKDPNKNNAAKQTRVTI
jgi:hypothetical protein